MAGSTHGGTRPRSVAVTAVVLAAAGVASVLIGLFATALDGCCGAPDSGDGTPALLGLVVGVAAGIAAVMLWLGGVSRWAVLGPSAAVPAATVAVSASSSDLAALAPFTVVGWLLLAWLVSRRAAAAWLARGSDARPDG